MIAKVSILHISDLHRDKDSPISNSAILTSLLNDREKYTSTEKPLIQAPDIIIICGDIARGSDSKENADKEIQTQYDEAIDLLNNLTNELFGGNKDRIILVPGNHDIDWKYSKKSMGKISSEQVLDANNKLKQEYLRRAINQRSNVKWSWDELSFYKIEDQSTYDKRFDAFVNFYNKFYEGKRSYSLSPNMQFQLLAITVVIIMTI